MDKRLHHFMDGFVLSCSSLHARISRFDIVGPPASPPCSMLLYFCFKMFDLFVWCACPCSSHRGFALQY